MNRRDNVGRRARAAPQVNNDSIDAMDISSTHQRPASSNNMVISSGGNALRGGGIPLTQMFPPDNSAPLVDEMAGYYDAYARGLDFEARERIKGNNVQLTNAQRIVTRAVNQINTLRNERETQLASQHEAEWEKISIPSAFSLDLMKLDRLYHDNFFNPAVLYVMRTILRGVTNTANGGRGAAEIKKERNGRIRHWIRDVKAVASGSFGATLVSGIASVNEFVALKYPLNPTTDQRHEFLVGLQVNKLRETGQSVNVVYTYHMFTCSGTKVRDGDEKGEVVTWCTSDRPTQYILMENVENNGTLENYLVNNLQRMSRNAVTSILSQVILNLKVLADAQITHWDHHLSNILASPVDSSTIVRFSYRGQWAYVATHGIVPTLFDWGLSSAPMGDLFVGPDPQLQENTSCYFNGRPFPWADIYRFFMNLYYLLMRNFIDTNAETADIRALASMVENILVFTFEVPQVRTLRAQFFDQSLSDNEHNRVKSDLRSLNFYRLPTKFQSRTTEDFIALFLGSQGYMASYNPAFSDVVTLNPPAYIPPELNLHCDVSGNPGAFCPSYATLIQTLAADPRDYFEVDLYRIDVKTLDRRALERVINDTIGSIQEDIRIALESAAYIRQHNLPPVPAGRGDMFHRGRDLLTPRAIIEEWVDVLLEWWAAEADLVFTNDMLTRLGSVPGLNEIREPMQRYWEQRDTATYDAAQKSLIDFERKFSTKVNQWYPNNADDTNDEHLIHITQRGLTFAKETLNVGDAPAAPRRTIDQVLRRRSVRMPSSSSSSAESDDT